MKGLVRVRFDAKKKNYAQTEKIKARHCLCPDESVPKTCVCQHPESGTLIKTSQSLKHYDFLEWAPLGNTSKTAQVRYERRANPFLSNFIADKLA